MAQRFDIAVIGGGVVGIAILRRFAMSGLRCVLLERGADILSGASKGNSALLHTGFDAPTGSLELQCIQAGYREYMAIRAKLNLPLLETSAVLVAWDAAQEQALDAIVARAAANAVPGVARIELSELRRRVPQLATHARAAVLIPGEHVIDPWSAPLAYARQAIAHGARVVRCCSVTGGDFSAGRWNLASTQGPVEAAVVVNAAGNFGDSVEAIARPAPFSIRPRKGQFVVFDKSAAPLVQSIVLPVPSAHTKGVVLFPTIFGNVAVGPSAEEQEEREYAACDAGTLKRLLERAYDMMPALAQHGITATYAGLRPASERSDYIIEALPQRNWITVAGIRSTGLTSCLGVAAYVEQLYTQHYTAPLGGAQEPVWTPVPNLAEGRERAYQRGGEIVCHCEMVTRSEIEAALQGSLPALDLGGLKRRTRATMGRCQGFYCSANVAAIMRAHHST